MPVKWHGVNSPRNSPLCSPERRIGFVRLGAGNINAGSLDGRIHWLGREIDIASDVRTMPEAAEILTEALGRPIAFAQTPIEQVRQYSEDMALMLEWFERVGYSADIAGLEREFGRALTKLPDWARRHARPNGQGEHA